MSARSGAASGSNQSGVNSVDLFHDRVITALHDIHQQEAQNVQYAAEVIARQVRQGGKLFTFGVGHSHLVADEAFGRAGGPTFVEVIWMSALMLHEGLQRSTRLERVPGIAAVLIEESGITRQDALLIISDAGENAVPVEMALMAQVMHIPVIGITSKSYAESVLSRHASGRKLMDIADVVIDNHGMPEDVLPIGRSDGYTAPTSTITGAYLIHSLMLEVSSILTATGYQLPAL